MAPTLSFLASPSHHDPKGRTAMTPHPADVLDFWFAGDPAARRDHWFKRTDDFDVACLRFADAAHDARAGHLDPWADTAEGALALILLLDQFPRNLFRGSPEAFAADPRARAIARRAVERGFDTGLTPAQRMFVYLPFEHSEDLGDQNESVRLFEPLRDALGADTVDYAARHRAVIARYGRFPHRNAVLGRASTPEEEEYLAQPGAGF